MFQSPEMTHHFEWHKNSYFR